MSVALLAGTAYRYFVEDREKRKVKGLFGRYVSRDVYQQLLDNPALATLGGRRRDMTVLFSDIRGFTSITEKGNPEELVGQLNEYFTRMVDVVFRNRGTVDKFVGDMVMALFGAPVDDVDHAEHAVAAATEMVRELGVLNRQWAAAGRATLDIGIGVNTGEMIAGNIGSSTIMSYTVIGDHVNLGSRLESLNKDYRTRIIISDATRARLTGVFDIRPLGEVDRQRQDSAGRDFRGRGSVADSPAERNNEMKHAALAFTLLLTAAPAFAQLGGLGSKIGKAKEIGDKVVDLKVSEADERKIGEAVSVKVRDEFGVFQDAAVTKYVTLVGIAARQGQRAAQPEMGVHRPRYRRRERVRGAGRDRAHHPRGAGDDQERSGAGRRAGARGRARRSEAHGEGDRDRASGSSSGPTSPPAAGSGSTPSPTRSTTTSSRTASTGPRRTTPTTSAPRLANKVGYNPSGLGAFLTKLMDRNKGATEKNGLFASHPDTQSRIDRLARQITAGKLAATAMVAPRYASAITFDAKPMAAIATVTEGSKGVAGGSAKTAPEEKKEEPKKKGFGISGLGLSKGKQAETTQANASAGGRAVGRPDRFAKGGDNPAKVSVTVTAGGSRGLREGYRLAPALSLLHASPHRPPDHERRGAGCDARHDQRHAQRAGQAQAAALRLPVLRATSCFTSCSSCGRSWCRRTSITTCARSNSSPWPPAFINLLVVGIINPLRTDRVPDAFPAILQDADGHRHRRAGRNLRVRRQAADDVGGRRGDRRLRAAGHAGQRLRRPGDPEREAVSRRRVDQGRRLRRPGLRGDLAGHQAAHQVRQLRHRPQQHRGQGSDHQLLRAAGADADRGRGRGELPEHARRREAGDPRGGRQCRACLEVAAAGRAAARLRCVGDHLPCRASGSTPTSWTTSPVTR